MTAKIPDDLLSAFLDREVTPDEEALVRKHLQKSAQARQEFQDYQRLGQLLHELPRRTVPTEFAAAVMQQAERETLIP
ncbi:MAG TPA: zf-HC2 domain-containing protein, partial [Planctomycetaceae bacterium]|nr:zf-HC2 domain-containing protein [Planctomycetaceae bacterium]